MKVNLSRRSVFMILGAIAAAVFVSLAVWNRSQQGIEPLAEPAANGAPAAEPVLEAKVAAETQVDAAEDAERMDPAKRIVHVPDTRSEVTGELEPSEYIGANAAEFATDIIEKGLAGDFKTAGYLRSLTRVCETWLPEEGDDIENIVSSMMYLVYNRANSADPVPNEGIPWLWGGLFSGGPAIWVYPTEQQNRAHIVEWKRACKEMDSILSAKLRRELESLAREGHVMARYLYAMWKPKTVLRQHALEAALQWQMNATDFSYANVIEGEPAGFLAFGESYLQGLFTPLDGVTGNLMLNAAYKCGYESPEIMQFFERFESGEQGRIQLENELGVTPERFDELTAQLTAGCR